MEMRWANQWDGGFGPIEQIDRYQVVVTFLVDIEELYHSVAMVKGDAE
jgi:hypothetical protein